MFDRLQNLPKIFLALLIQLLAFAILSAGVYLAPMVVSPPYPLWLLVVIQGVLAASLSCKLGLPCWWRWIQFALPVGLYGALQLEINPLWALIAFLLIWLTFKNASSERVPLYLTNNTTREALKSLLENKQAVHFLDLGSGLGGNVAFMSQQAQVAESHGVETAPIPFIVSRFLSVIRGGKIFAMDMWKTDLAYYDVVYAFLSPEPMPKLWQKVRAEMQPGSVFVSNSFAVPEIEPDEIWELSDGRKTQLYIYKIA